VVLRRGQPRPGPDPDALDAHELAVLRGSTASPEDMKALFEAVTASADVAVLRGKFIPTAAAAQGICRALARRSVQDVCIEV
jgi:hypothetical protein